MTYTKEDYNSNNGMLTTVWGPPLWHFLHLMSFNYPVKPTKKQKSDYKRFICDLRNVLPCKTCRDNFVKHLEKNPIDDAMKNRNTFSRYIYCMHEKINKYLGKESGLTYKVVKERYEHFRSRCAKKTMKTKNKKEGCSVAFKDHKKIRTLLSIVPSTKRCKTLKIDKKCWKK